MMRYHPLTILFHIYNLVKNSAFIAILLFVVNRESDLWLFEYGRYAFLAIILWRFIYIILSWFFEQYHWKNQAFHMRKGIFVKTSSTIPFSRVQNVTKKTTVFHKLFGLTSLSLDTTMEGEGESIYFAVVSKQHADFLVDLVQEAAKEKKTTQEEDIRQSEIDSVQGAVEHEEGHPQKNECVIHFTADKKDLIKASFTSLSFLAIIPISFVVYDYLQSFLPGEDEMEGVFQTVVGSVWLIVTIVASALVIAVGFGVIRTFIRYGNFRISSDNRHIYIDKGVLDESYFAIEKRKVQGLEITQSLMKRIFGLAEVKIISSTSRPEGGNEQADINSLYPFLPVKEAYRLIEEILPEYRSDAELNKLPTISLWVKLLEPSWLWIVSTIALVYFKPDFFQIQQIWWIVIIVLFCLVVLQRVLDYKHTKYAVIDDQVQWWNGGLSTKMFMTKRKNMIGMTYSQTKLQGYFGVASLTAMNRSTPVRVEVINDIPFSFALQMETWYLNRSKEIEITGK
ncbi:PH domain-containing protein [Salimicrobium sp. PL1-032A]|uniref:PH domain-containing protein n=1 Tax=Salimicrobium sp. PL1-032A TaxID=3095364 RepID=UPI003261D293